MKMASLTTIAQTFKKAAPVLVFLLLITLLIGLILFRYKKPMPQLRPTEPVASPSIPQNPNLKQPTSFDFSQVQKPTVPNSLPVFKAQPTELIDSLAQAAASSFGITTKPLFIDENTLDSKLYSFKEDDITLAISQTVIRYEKKSFKAEEASNLTEQDLQNSVLSFIQKKPILDKTVVFNPQKTKYLKKTPTGRLASARSFADAQIVEFSYDKNLVGLPLIETSPDLGQTTVRITKSGEIIYLRSRFFANLSESDPHPTKTPKEAIAEVAAGQGKIVQTALLDESAQALELFRFQPVDIGQLNVVSINLAYFVPQNLAELLQPIYVFEGYSQKAIGQKIRVIVYLPAVKN